MSSNGHTAPVTTEQLVLVQAADLRHVLHLALTHLDAAPYQAGDWDRYAATTRLVRVLELGA